MPRFACKSHPNRYNHYRLKTGTASEKSSGEVENGGLRLLRRSAEAQLAVPVAGAEDIGRFGALRVWAHSRNAKHSALGGKR